MKTKHFIAVAIAAAFVFLIFLGAPLGFVFYRMWHGMQVLQQREHTLLYPRAIACSGSSRQGDL
jgi:hypothetical protein